MLNMVQFIGNIAKDPVTKVLSEKCTMVEMTIAVKRDFKNKNGEYDTDFINVELYNAAATFTTNYCNKGDMVYVAGGVRQDKYTDKDGKTKWSNHYVMQTIQKLSSKKNDTQEQSNSNPQVDSKPKTVPLHDMEEITDEDLPF